MVTGPLKEAGATRFILIHTISSAQNFTGTILVDVIVTKISHIFLADTPVLRQVGTAALQRAVLPHLDVDESMIDTAYWFESRPCQWRRSRSRYLWIWAQRCDSGIHSENR